MYVNKHPYSLQNISIVWLSLGCLVLCASILLGVMAVARPYVKNKVATSSITANVTQSTGFIVTPRAQAETISTTTPTQIPAQTYSSDSASLYPSLP